MVGRWFIPLVAIVTITAITRPVRCEMTADQVRYYVNLFQKVREQPEWAELMKNGAFNQTFMSGDEYRKWLETEETRHRTLMT